MLILEQDEFLLEKECVCEKERRKREKGAERGERGRRRDEEKL